MAPVFVLGIETSCDDTAVAVVQAGLPGGSLVRSEAVSSQISIHEAYGGVVPELASRAHLANLPVLTDQVMRQAQIDYTDLAALGVTRGPGLKGCLLMGLNFARAVSWRHDVPFIGVHHIEAHIHAVRLGYPDLTFPFLTLVVSGGHTEIVEVQGLGQYQIHARTTDDAAGEAFDKSANLLGFAYPGGASLARCAEQHKGPPSFRLPRVMRESAGFSFSGLKTAIATLVKQERERLENDEDLRADFCAAVQEAIVGTLCYKLQQCVVSTGIHTVCLAGGVSANTLLRQRVQSLPGVTAFFPEFKHCTDNAAMIAFLAAERFERGQRDSLDIGVLSRWPVESLACPEAS